MSHQKIVSRCTLDLVSAMRSRALVMSASLQPTSWPVLKPRDGERVAATVASVMGCGSAVGGSAGNGSATDSSYARASDVASPNGPTGASASARSWVSVTATVSDTVELNGSAMVASVTLASN